MATRTVLSARVPESTTPTLTLSLKDKAGALITNLDTLVGTLYNVKTGEVINSRSNFNLLPFVSGGVLTWVMNTLDNPIFIDRKDAEELHRLQLVWTWSAGVERGAHEIDFYVANFMKIP